MSSEKPPAKGPKVEVKEAKGKMPKKKVNEREEEGNCLCLLGAGQILGGLVCCVAGCVLIVPCQELSNILCTMACAPEDGCCSRGCKNITKGLKLLKGEETQAAPAAPPQQTMEDPPEVPYTRMP